MKTTKQICEIQNLQSEKLTYNLLLDEKERDQLLELKKADFENGYVKTLYSDHPDGMTFDGQCEYDMSCKFNRNKRIDLDGKRFYRMYYVIKLQNEIIGALEIYQSGECAEFGLFIGQKFSKQGFGKEALRTAIKFVREEIKGSHEMKWECYTDNDASCRVAESCGFKKDGDDQHMYNVGGLPRYGRVYKLK